MGVGGSRMRRKKAFSAVKPAKPKTRGRVISILLAGCLGYLLGGWHTAMLRSNAISPAETVALRFPEPGDSLAALPAAADETVAATASVPKAEPNVLGDAQLALLSPVPMVPPTAENEPPAVEPAPATQAVEPPPSPLPPRRPQSALPHPTDEPRWATDRAPRRSEHHGFMLTDAQIANIKARLHLSPDQERMWPAVEAALRNIAYARARDAQRRGASAGTRLAGLDPTGAEVEDLKSAAIPLIMSFNDEQKNEVRNLAHTMGLDQLASEF